ncbi:MAG: serine protease [Sphingobacterium sp.]|jgi:S1-C subfamily serine protease|uniref:S1 family peptidase n=1 Tax=Sphingobacterium sp. TaxID=341027 RepID=UPI0028426EBD|nr:serine protease [Sphingobacterium sp.]MDR3010889.1 serine protease [Sphingobacterium sp.]
MEDSLDEKNRIRRDKLKDVYDNFAAGVGYISVILPNGNESIGSCFHIGEGIFITARHVVDKCIIKEIGTTIYQTRYYETTETKDTGRVRSIPDFSPKSTTVFKGPYMHPDDSIDVAAIVVSDLEAPVLMLGDHLDDWLGNEYVLSDVLLLGYPPIPFANQPLLISAKCEVNAIVDKYTGGHPHFILSTMARGGFSGSPAITEAGIVLGVTTEALGVNNQPIELGYLAVMSVEGIYTCLAHHKLIPKYMDEQWDGFWSKETVRYRGSGSEQ